MPNNCMLHRAPVHCKNMGYDARCTRCGWDKEEAYRRANYTRRHGLTKCKDGLYRVQLPRDWYAEG